jgi:membrane protein
MISKKSVKAEWWLWIGSLRKGVILFQKNDPLRLGGATAFFTTFALPPIIFILVQLFGFFIGRRDMGQGLLKRISEALGDDGAQQVRQVLRSIRGFNDSWYTIIIGFIFLVFISTTLFSVIKKSLNQIWQIRVKGWPGFLFFLTMRARSLALILLSGILFFADLLFESLGVITGSYIEEIWQGGGIYFQSGISKIAGIIIVSAWFVILFRFLGDGRPAWKASVAGGILTGILFSAGRLLLRFLLTDRNLHVVYGASGSLVLILLFVFYSSFILYFGACFIASYSEKKGWKIIPMQKAYHYRIQEVK